MSGDHRRLRKGAAFKLARACRFPSHSRVPRVRHILRSGHEIRASMYRHPAACSSRSKIANGLKQWRLWSSAHPSWLKCVRVPFVSPVQISRYHLGRSLEQSAWNGIKRGDLATDESGRCRWLPYLSWQSPPGWAVVLQSCWKSASRCPGKRFERALGQARVAQHGRTGSSFADLPGIHLTNDSVRCQ